MILSDIIDGNSIPENTTKEELIDLISELSKINFSKSINVPKITENDPYGEEDWEYVDENYERKIENINKFLRCCYINGVEDYVMWYLLRLIDTYSFSIRDNDYKYKIVISNKDIVMRIRKMIKDKEIGKIDNLDIQKTRNK